MYFWDRLEFFWHNQFSASKIIFIFVFIKRASVEPYSLNSQYIVFAVRAD